MELSELIVVSTVTISTILISLWFCFFFTSQTSHMDLLNNNQVEEGGTRRKKKKSDTRLKASESSSRRSSISLAGGDTAGNQNEIETLQKRLTNSEKQLVETKMKNLKLLKMLETAEERNRDQTSQVEALEVCIKRPNVTENNFWIHIYRAPCVNLLRK